MAKAQTTQGARRVYTAEEKAEYAEKQNKKGENVRRVNAMLFAKAAMDGSLPAYGKSFVDEKTGKIRFQPSAVRSSYSGRAYSGINQNIAQLFAEKYGWEKAEDGCYYCLTAKQAGGYANIVKSAKRINIVTTTHKDVTTSRDDSTDPVGNEYESRTYGLFSENSVIDPNLTVVRDDSIYHRRNLRPDLEIDATDAKSPAEFFGKYNAACQLGATFVTDKETVEKVQDMAKHELSAAVSQNLDGKVYSWAKGFGEESKKVITETFDTFRAQHSPQAKELANIAIGVEDMEAPDYERERDDGMEIG